MFTTNIVFVLYKMNIKRKNINYKKYHENYEVIYVIMR